jgi:hypothetical protein
MSDADSKSKPWMTAEQTANREARLKNAESARKSPIFAPYFQMVAANVSQESTIVTPAPSPKYHPHTKHSKTGPKP